MHRKHHLLSRTAPLNNKRIDVIIWDRTCLAVCFVSSYKFSLQIVCFGPVPQINEMTKIIKAKKKSKSMPNSCKENKI